MMIRSFSRSRRVLIGLSAAIVAVIILQFVLAGDAIEAWSARYLAEAGSRWAVGTFLFLLLLSDIVLPIPSSLAATAAGKALGAVVGTIVAGGGMATGAFAGFLVARWLGRDRVAASVGTVEFARLAGVLAKRGPLIVLLCRPIPILAETSVLVAGACGASVRAIAGPILLGSFATGGVYAYLGSTVHDWTSFVLVFVASCLIPAIGWAFARRS